MARLKLFPDFDYAGDAEHTQEVNMEKLCAPLRLFTFEPKKTFPGEPKLQRQACWVLLTLAANDEISKMIASEGGIGAIIAAMLNNVE